MISDDGKRFCGSTRKPPWLFASTAKEVSEIGRSLEMPPPSTLDQFDTMSARTFDNEVGVNHSYIFAELLWAKVEGLGKEDRLYLSPTDLFGSATFLVGLALEF